MKDSEIRVGDVVEWTSQSHAYETRKIGVVLAVIEPYSTEHSNRVDINAVCDFSLVPGPKEHRMMFDCYYERGQPIFYARRGKKSYFISVKIGKTDKAKRGLYCPVQPIKKITGYRRIITTGFFPHG